MLQFGFHHNILYGHLMRLLGPLHTSFENLGNHQAIYGLIVPVIDLNRAHLAIHAAGNAFDLKLPETSVYRRTGAALAQGCACRKLRPAVFSPM